MWVIHTVPGVDLCAQERNVRLQKLDKKRKNKTRDGFCIPGLIAEPTCVAGTYDTPAVYRIRVEHARGAPGPWAGA